MGVKQTLPVALSGAQFVAMGLWSPPLPVMTIVLTTLIVNLRQVLMGASLRRWLAQLPARKTYSLAFFISGGSWALTMREFTDGRADAAFLLGSGLMLFPFWVGSSVLGNLVGTAIPDPAPAWERSEMIIDPATLATILGMALATYVTRASGLWLMGRLPTSARVEAGLRRLPGAVLISLIAPSALTRSPVEAIATWVTILVAARTRNVLLAMLTGIAVVWALRQLVP